MSAIRYLIDENLPPALVTALRRREPTLDVRRVGEEGMPVYGAPDPELLVYCEAERRVLVSLDQATLPLHIRRHIESGAHTWGVLFISGRSTFAEAVNDLLLMWSASTAEEWRDTMIYLPLT